MPRAAVKKQPSALTFFVADEGLRSQVRVYRIPAATKRTFELRWIDPATGERDTHRIFDSGDLAEKEAGNVAARIRDGLQPHLGRVTRQRKQESAAPRRRTETRTLVTVRDEWKAGGFQGKPGSLENALYNLENYGFREMPEIDALGKPTGRTFSLARYALEDLTETEFIIWERSLAQVISRFGTPMGSATRALTLRNLKALINFAKKQGYVSTNVAAGVRVKLFGAKKPDSFENEAQMFKALEYLVEWAKAPVVVLAYTGARYGEGAALLVSAIDTKNCRIYFERTLKPGGGRETTKTVSSEDYVSYHPSLTPILEAHIATLHESGPNDVLFPGQRMGKNLQNSSLNRNLKLACERAGLDVRVTCHGLRHSLAGWLNAIGTPLTVIQKILRHADIRTTMGYIKVTEKQAAEAMAQLGGVRI